MGAYQTELSDKQLLWQSYREAWYHLEQEAQRVTRINLNSLYDPAYTEQALLSLEQARITYNESRDRLAASLMPPALSTAFLAIPPAVTQTQQTRVKDIAELFWQLAGKPQGSALDDWYRAERVVTHTRAEACCAS